jgi:hypothetical protein
MQFIAELLTRPLCLLAQNMLGTFRQYAFLWMQDVERTFKEFLAGNIVAHPRGMSGAEILRSGASLTSQRAKREKGTRT